MSERAPVITAQELETLNDDEIYAGYRSGRSGDDEPGGNSSKSYWHGWCNGRVDGGFAQPDAAQMSLIRELPRMRTLFAAIPTPTKGPKNDPR